MAEPMDTFEVSPQFLHEVGLAAIARRRPADRTLTFDLLELEVFGFKDRMGGFEHGYAA